MAKKTDIPNFGPLNGVRVVHCSLSLAGPFAASLMADLGADVIWVESAVGQDVSRIAPGMAADMFLVDTRRAELVGAALDPKNMLATVGLNAPVDYAIINGRVTIAHRRVITQDEASLARRGREAVARYLG